MSVVTGKYQDKLPSGYKTGQLQRFDPARMQLFEKLIGGVQPGVTTGTDFLSQMAAGSPEFFERMEAPAMRQFGQLQSGIANRFAIGGGGQGAMSNLRGSGHRNVQSGAAADLAERLQAQRMGLQMSAIDRLREMAMQLLGHEPYSRFITEKGPSGFEKAMGIGLPIAGGVAGGIFGGPMGAATGAQLGSLGGSAFTGKQFTPNFSGIGDLPKTWGS